ncbi:hypothetical protein ZIOFF_058585 [Zingiber officinale]|uniref:Uncharacterized protein n=1 Tax=Zingiber officinale TaxID=94328 RepID=A0A8J5F6I6_ZINOF|nr:hypothetical protein ZIOFF_058585 [Zingiber officinale]
MREEYKYRNLTLVPTKKSLICLATMRLLVLLCFGLLLACKSEKVRGWKEEPEMKTNTKARYLRGTEVSSEKLDAGKNAAAGPSPLDPNAACKRRVRRGSDPIHNRC